MIKLLLALLPALGFCFIESVVESNGTSLKIRSQDVRVYIDSELTHHLNENETIDVINASFQSWSQNSNLTFDLQYTPSIPERGSSTTLSFSNEEDLGTGVLGITYLGFEVSSGLINSSDIVINTAPIESGTYRYTTKKHLSVGTYTSFVYPNVFLGDILTHEVGHLLGFAHSETQRSTMKYVVHAGQYNIDPDDETGAKAKWGGSSGYSIQGKLVKTAELQGVYGIAVYAINANSGKVDSSVVTDESGQFLLKNLSGQSSYVLHYGPLKSRDNLPAPFAGADYNICPGSIVSGFYSKCGEYGVGRPERINFKNSTHVQLGPISVHCSSKINKDYLSQKFSTIRDDVNLSVDGKNSYSFVGLFFDEEITLSYLTSQSDEFILDYTHISDNPSDYRVKVSVLTEAIGSNLDLRLEYKEDGGVTYSARSFVVDSEYLGDYLNFSEYIYLTTNSLDNLFNLKLTPRIYEDLSKLESIFGSVNEFVNNDKIYALNMTLEKYENGTWSEVFDEFSPEDNTYCAEGTVKHESAPLFEPSTGNVAQATSGGVGCASVRDRSKSNKNGIHNLFSFMFSCFLILGSGRLRNLFLSKH